MDHKKPVPEPETDAKQNIFDEASLDRELVFHYSRDHRLAKASPALRAFNESGPQKRPTVFSTLTATRSHKVLLVSIIVLSVFISVMSRITKETNLPSLEGNRISASGVRREGTTTLTVKKTFKDNAGVYTGAVDIAVTPSLPTGNKNALAETRTEAVPIATYRIFFTLNPAETFSLSIPFEAPSLLILMQAEDTYINFKVRPK